MIRLLWWLGVANALLRPISARLRLREEAEELRLGRVFPGKVGAANVLAAKSDVTRWESVGVKPEEITLFDAARKRWTLAHQGGLV